MIVSVDDARHNSGWAWVDGVIDPGDSVHYWPRCCASDPNVVSQVNLAAFGASAHTSKPTPVYPQHSPLALGLPQTLRGRRPLL
jgi:hypothetical protein